MNDKFEPTPFDDVIRQGLRAAPGDAPIAGLAQRAIAIASSHAPLNDLNVRRFPWSRLLTLLEISAIVVIFFLGWPSLSTILEGDQITTEAISYSMASAASNITWIIIAGAVSFAAIIFATLSRPAPEINEHMFIAS